MNKTKPCVNTDIDCKLFADCSQCEKEYHKGEPCLYKDITCIEGFCFQCAVPITCTSCGLTDKDHVHIVDFWGVLKPYCDETMGCLKRGTQKLIDENHKKAGR